MEYIVKKEEELLSFLKNNVKGSKNNIKSFLSKELVAVNGKTIRQFNYLVKPNDIVTIGAQKVDSFLGKIKIIYEDDNYLVVDKPSGMLTIATEEEKEANNNLYSVLTKYVKKKNSVAKLFVVHRLDKDTSGVVLFAKNEKLKNILQEKWNEIATRIYFAVVIGITKESETLKSYLKEDDNLVTYQDEDGKLAITEYKRIKNNDDYSLLEINIKTGRRNQIRVQLKEIHHPILGDSKYGHKDKNHKRMMLHAAKLVIEDPISNKKIEFLSKVPYEFERVVS